MRGEGLPQGSVNDFIPWSDDDVDATDFEKMPDYDSEQEDSLYNSTPDLEIEATASTTENHSFEDATYSCRYVKLHDEETVSRGQSSGERDSHLHVVDLEFSCHNVSSKPHLEFSAASLRRV